MDVVSQGPLLVSGLVWQPRQGAHALTVICKATFNLEPVTSPLAPLQRPPWTNNLQWDRHFEQMMEVAGDYAPFKRRAEILVTGRAIPPPNNRLSTIKASIAVGAFSKTIEVHVQQNWTVAALGPLAPTWPVRTAFLGRHASTWNHAMWNTQPVPEDIDGAFFNSASVDQQLEDVTGQEPIVLENLHPRYPKLWTQLVRVIPRATVNRMHGASQDIRLRCDTLTIDADDGLAMLTWRGVVLLEHPAEPGVVTIDAQIAKSDSQLPAPLKSPEASLYTTIAQPSVGAVTGSLPFIPGPPQVPNLGENAKAPGSSFPPPPRNVPGTNRPKTMTLSIDDAPAELKTVLPFQSESGELRKLPTSRPAPAPPAIVNLAPSSFDVPPVIAPPVAPPAAIVAEKPAMIGPIATPEKVVETPQSAEQAQPATAKPQTPTLESVTKNLSITEHATIAAEFAEGKKSRADILRAHELSADDWKTNDERWKKALDDEERRGKRKLRETHDGAYVTRVEEFRGKITIEEVSRILVGFERRNAREILDELRIQRAALMPIVRVWVKQIATDSRASSKAATLMRDARQT